MTFEDKIKELEKLESNDNYIIRRGKYPILITAPHTMSQVDEFGNVKLNEPYTKAIALYLINKLDLYGIVKVYDTGIDDNKDIEEPMKDTIVNTIKENNILLSIDIHGAKEDREFDVELGTINNLSSDYSTLNELKEAFIENGISSVYINDPFKGGAITRTIYGKTNAEAIQIEINKKFRDDKYIENIEKLCNCLEIFIKQYIDTINRDTSI